MACQCTLKNHPKRAEIDQMAQDGVTYKVMRQRSGVGVTRLNWHVRNCLDISRNGGRPYKTCMVCAHEDREAIEYAMRETDEIYAGIAHRYGLSRYILTRHGLNCMHFSRAPHRMRYPDRLQNGWKIESKAIERPTERLGIGTPKVRSEWETEAETLDRIARELALTCP